VSKHGTIRRYTLIIEKIGRNQFPSFEMVRDYLFEHGFEISTRTIQRDLEQIRVEFGLEVRYDRTRNGYFIDTEKSINTDSFLRFLEIVTTAELLTESLKESKEALNFISFESQGDLKGIENLKPLLFAIRRHREISFTHENFYTGKQKHYLLKPYLLKEYQSRWYLLGKLGDSNEFRTFGIDRILSLEVKGETFQPELDVNPNDLFEHSVGPTYSQRDIENVVLSFTQHQGNYVKTLPLHHSQEIIVDSETELRVRLRIIPNYEFKQKVLMLGETVKALEPTWFADEIKNSLKATLKNYE
jgi:predicted DNA-binding transcriptional regulator YafY